MQMETKVITDLPNERYFTITKVLKNVEFGKIAEIIW